MTKVLISGAGLGGLCLAQMLHRGGFEVAVFERDPSPSSRTQGYRLHIDGDGLGALKVALPEALFQAVEATAMRPLHYTNVVDSTLHVKRRVAADDYSRTQHHVAAGQATHVNMNRATLRQLLFSGLTDYCKFDSRLTRYESDEDGVTAYLANGSQVRGDVLVGADGVNSTVRVQRAPEARVMDTGLRGICWRLPIHVARTCLPPYVFADVFTTVTDARKIALGLGAVLFPMPPTAAAQLLVPDVKVTEQSDYVMCVMAIQRQYLGADDNTLHTCTSERLQRVASELLDGWSPPLQAAVRGAEVGSFFFLTMSSSIPCQLSASPNVTLLGDAVHAMSPSLGRGANVALRDAALLGRALLNAPANARGLSQALRSYEHEMTEYSFDVVRSSAEQGARLLGQLPLPA